MAVGEIVEPVAMAMILGTYTGIFLFAGLILLGSLLLPWGFLRRARMFVGAGCLVVAIAIFVYASTIYPA